MTNKKILIAGDGGHGKDTFCEILRDMYGYTFASSSMVACAVAVYPTLKVMWGYETIEECYADRRNHRKAWFNLIAEYNEKDPIRLAKHIYSSNTIYNGIRRREEFEAIVKEFKPIVVWVDASDRLQDSKEDTQEIKAYECNWIINNNGGMELLKDEAWLFNNKIKEGYYEQQKPA